MRHGEPGKRKRKRREDFGLRWQSAAATPLFDCGQSFQAAWRFASRRSPKKFGGGGAELLPFAALVFSGRTTGRAGTLHGFASKSASFTPVSSPAASARSVGPVMIANLRKKNPLIFGQALDRKKIEFIVYF
jgi:hypothetical protein